MNIKMLSWLIGMWVAGGFVYSIFGLQISITKRCAMKLYTFVKDETHLWYPEACRKYLKKVIRTNTVIICITFLMVLFFIPLIGFLGYLGGFFLKSLTTRSASGLTGINLKDSAEILLKFAKAEKEDNFLTVLIAAADKLSNKDMAHLI